MQIRDISLTRRTTDRFAGLPFLMRTGLVLLAVALLADLLLHGAAAVASSGLSHGGGLATTIHVLALAGMVVTFGGVLQTAFRSSVTARKEMQ